MESTKLYEENINYIKKINPTLHKSIIDADISNMKIHISDGNINIIENGKAILPKNSTEHLATKIERFLKNPTAIYKSPTISELGEFSKISDGYCMKIESIMPEQHKDTSLYHQHLDSIPVLLMFSLGTGQQIEHIINTVDVKTLIISDKSFSYLKISLSLIDWKSIFQYFMRPGYMIKFIVSSKPHVIAYQSINEVFSKYKQFSYYINFFVPYESDFNLDVLQNFHRKYKLSLSGWGFYDDEKTSIMHTIQNLNKSTNIYKLKQPISNDSSVFIIASGPSIDNDIEFIKQNKDKVIIFSCGSALKILESNGLKPDYHFEIERNEVTFEHLIKSIPVEYLKEINFIGLNVVYPNVYDLFKTTKIFFRVNDGGTSMVSGQFEELDHTNPTVTNGVVSFASSIGFKNIYLFGADMGYKDETSHHSKHSIYQQKDAKRFYDWKPKTSEERFKQNFAQDNSEDMLSTDILSWCKTRIENCILDYNTNQNKDINYFNCSDGVYIKGTNPLRSSDIDITVFDISKDQLLNDIENNFIQHTPIIHESIKSALSKHKKNTKTIIKNLINILKSNKKINSIENFISIANSIMAIIIKDRNKYSSSMASTLINGTLSHLFSTIYTHSLMSKNYDDIFPFIQKSLLIIVEFLELALKDLNKLQIK